jgi:PAS domain S-box-containing protein
MKTKAAQDKYRWRMRSLMGLWRHTGALPCSPADCERTRSAARGHEERFRWLIENSTDVIVEVDAGGILRYASPSLERVVGWRPEELLGTHGFGLIHPDDLLRTRAAFDRALRTPGATGPPLQVRCRHRDGAWRHVEATGKSLADTSGHLVIVLCLRDITAQKQAEDTLAARTRQLEAVRVVNQEITRELDLARLLDLIHRRAAELVQAERGGIALWDETNQRLDIRSWHGYGPWVGTIRPALGQGVAGLVAQRREGMIVNDYRASPYASPVFRERTDDARVLCEPLLYHDRLLGVILVANPPGPPPFTDEDQHLIRLFASQAAISIENARLYEASAQAAHETRSLYEAAEQAAREAQSLYEVAHSLTTSLSPGEILQLIAEKTTELLGTPYAQVLLWDETTQRLRFGAAYGTEAELIKAQEFQLGQGVHGIVVQTRQPLIVNEYQAFPQRLRGMTDLVAVIGVPLLFRHRLLGVLTSHATQPGSLFTQDHLALLTSFANQAAIALENGRLFAELTHSYQDLQKAQEELIRSEKLRALGQMAAGIAHDLNNTLAAILGQVELLRLQVQNPEARERLRILMTAATDGAHVVRRLQGFARQQLSPTLVVCDLATLVHEAVELTRPRWRDEPLRSGVVIEVRTALSDPGGLPPILGQPAEIREALTNLILNAVDAMPDGGTLRIAARRAVAQGGQLVESSPGQVGRADPGEFRDPLSTRPVEQLTEWVELEVSDTGVGMSAEVQARIFDPFFTTKGVRGTGLGLSVVYGIMEQHGGHIAVTSAPGRGTTVTLRFQAAPAVSTSGGPGPAQRHSPSRRLLVIDDDPVVRRTLAALLRMAGHTVTEAEGGAQGLAWLTKEPVDCVLTDLGMPELTGWDVARDVKAQAPRCPVILLTGWGELPAEGAQLAGLVDRVLGKPVRLEDLLAVIAAVTERHPSAS